MAHRVRKTAIILAAAFLSIGIPSHADLVSWWKFAGNVQDANGLNDGTINGSPSFTAGVVGQGLRFGGTDDGVNVADSPSLKLTHSLTIRTHIFLDSYNNNTGLIFFRGDERGGLDPYFLAATYDRQVTFTIESVTEIVGLSAPIETGRWYTVMATLDDATGKMRLYLDDVLVAQRTTSVRPFGDLDAGSSPGIGIGNHGNLPNSIHRYPFPGVIDELKVYNSAETPDTLRPHVFLQNQTEWRTSFLTVKGSTFTGGALVSPFLPTNWRVAAVNDFNGDGWEDLVMQNNLSRAIAILTMHANTVVGTVTLQPTLSENWRVVASGDFSGDEKPDLLVQNTVTQQVSVLTFDGNTITSSTPLSQRLQPGWLIVGAADFNGDGKTDIAVQNTSTREIRILTLNGTSITGGTLLNPTLPVNWFVGGVGDYNGDGRPDLLVQNSSTGQVAVLAISEMKIVKSYSLSPFPLSGWMLVGPK
jgi:hypothetical protein